MDSGERSAMLTYVRNTRIEWGDCDPAGHRVLSALFRDVRQLHHRRCSRRRSACRKFEFIKHYEFAGYPMVDTRARFLKPTRFGDDVVIETTVTEFRRSSFDVQPPPEPRRRAGGRMLRHAGLGGARSRRSREDQGQADPAGGDREIRCNASASDVADAQTRHLDHRRVGRHRRGAGARVRRPRP